MVVGGIPAFLFPVTQGGVALIIIENVSFAYRTQSGGETPALQGVNLTVRPGEWITILGANGSGKSTLAKHLNALLLPDEGRVTVEGLDTADRTSLYAIRRLVGMVFQNPDNQLVAPTVEEDVAFGPENLGLPRMEIKARVDQALKAVGLSALRHRPSHSLSGGQKQCLAVAGVLAIGPKYLVLDEATAMLDPAARQEVLAVVRQLHLAFGMGVIMITHLMEEAVTADRVIIMGRGRILLAGDPDSVFRQVDLLTQANLELPPVAELACRLHGQGVPLDLPVLTLEKLVRELCRLRSTS
ncbi:MAG: energy-coupling factor transporter ATPase [Heliobacteriaceae bacterium]|nr:energy-coupling factor transporter ATPase [Heliobacteriaceae bacterium]MDD4587993.1 energy-coupling factor transporter ATPase [Heliobacteriaceae bacterium]